MGHGLISEKSGLAINVKYKAPWHGFGKYFDGTFTVEEALRDSKSDFIVAKKSIQRVNPVTGKLEELPNTYEIIRMDDGTTLGIVGNGYQPLQNHEAFSFIGNVFKNQPVIESAGSLFDGQKVFILVRLEDDMIVGGTDHVKKYLLFSHGHDGRTCITVTYTPVRVECANTLGAALSMARQSNNSDKNTYRFRHTSNVMERLQEGLHAMGIANAYFSKSAEIYGEMAGFQLRPKDLQRYFTQVLPDEAGKPNTARINKRAEWTEVFETSPAIVGTAAEGNLWGAFNAISESDQYANIETIAKKGKAGLQKRFDNLTLNANNPLQQRRDLALTTAIRWISNN